MTTLNPQIAQQVAQFNRDGFLAVPDALSGEQVERLLDGVREAFAQPPRDEIVQAYGSLTRIWRPMMFESGPVFEELVDNPRLLDLVEAIVGPDCHLIANSALCTAPGNAIDTWHSDETVRFPIPRGVSLDPRIEMPCLVLGLNYYSVAREGRYISASSF